MRFYLKLANNNHVGILDVLLTETRLVTRGNPGLLPLRSHIRLIRAESETGRIWDHHTGIPGLIYTICMIRTYPQTRRLRLSSRRGSRLPVDESSQSNKSPK